MATATNEKLCIRDKNIMNRSLVRIGKRYGSLSVAVEFD